MPSRCSSASRTRGGGSSKSTSRHPFNASNNSINAPSSNPDRRKAQMSSSTSSVFSSSVNSLSVIQPPQPPPFAPPSPPPNPSLVVQPPSPSPSPHISAPQPPPLSLPLPPPLPPRMTVQPPSRSTGGEETVVASAVSSFQKIPPAPPPRGLSEMPIATTGAGFWTPSRWNLPGSPRSPPHSPMKEDSKIPSSLSPRRVWQQRMLNDTPAVASPSRSAGVAGGIRFEGTSANSFHVPNDLSAAPLAPPPPPLPPRMSAVAVGEARAGGGNVAEDGSPPRLSVIHINAAPIHGILSTPEKKKKTSDRRVSFAEVAATAAPSRKGRAVPRLQKQRPEGGSGVRSRWGRRKGRSKQEDKVPLTLFAVGATMVFVQKMKAVGLRWQKEQQRIAAMPRAAFIIQCAMRRVWAEDRLRVVRAQCFLVHWISFRYRQLQKAKGRSALFLQRFFKGERDRSFVRFMHFRMRMNAALIVLRGYVQRWEAQNLLSRLRDKRDERNELFKRCKLASLRLLRAERVEWIELVQQARATLGVCPLLPAQDWALAVEECSGVNPLELLQVRPVSSSGKSTSYRPICPIFLRRISSTSLMMASSSNPPTVTPLVMQQVSSPSASNSEVSATPSSIQCQLSNLSFRVTAGKPAYLKSVPYSSVVQSLNSSQHLPPISAMDTSSPDTSLTAGGPKDLTSYERSNRAIVSANQTFIQTAAAADARLLQLYQRTSQKQKGMSKAIPLLQQLSSIAVDAHRFTETLFVCETPHYLDDLFDLGLIRRNGGISNCSSSVNTRGDVNAGRHHYSVSTKSIHDARSSNLQAMVSNSTLSIEGSTNSSSSQRAPISTQVTEPIVGDNKEEDAVIVIGGGVGRGLPRAMVSTDECRWESQSDCSVTTLPATPCTKLDASTESFFPPYSPQITVLKPPIPPNLSSQSGGRQEALMMNGKDATVLGAFIQLLETTESVERKALQRRLWDAHRTLTLPFCLLSYTITLSRTVPPLFSGLLIDMVDAEFMEKAAALFNYERQCRLKVLEEYSNVPLQHLSRPSLHPGPEVRVRKMVRRAMAMPDPLEQARHSNAALRQVSLSTQGFIDGQADVLLTVPLRRLTSTVSTDYGSESDIDRHVDPPHLAKSDGAPPKRRLKVSMAPVVHRRRVRRDSVVSTVLGVDDENGQVDEEDDEEEEAVMARDLNNYPMRAKIHQIDCALPSHGFPLPILLTTTPTTESLATSAPVTPWTEQQEKQSNLLGMIYQEQQENPQHLFGERQLLQKEKEVSSMMMMMNKEAMVSSDEELLGNDIAAMSELPVLVVHRTTSDSSPRRSTPLGDERVQSIPPICSSSILSRTSTPIVPSSRLGSSVSRTLPSSCQSAGTSASPSSLPPLPSMTDRHSPSSPFIPTSCDGVVATHSLSSSSSESSVASSPNSTASLSWPPSSTDSHSTVRCPTPPPPPPRKVVPPSPPPRGQQQHRLSIGSSLTLHKSSSLSLDTTAIAHPSMSNGLRGVIISAAGTGPVRVSSGMSRGSDIIGAFLTPLVKNNTHFSEPERANSWSESRTEDEPSFASGSLYPCARSLDMNAGETIPDETIMNGHIPVGPPEDMDDIDDGDEDAFGDQVIVTRDFSL